MAKTIELDVRDIARRVDERTGIKSLKRFCEDTGIAEGSLRWMLFNEEQYGFERAGAVIRFHRRIFIDADRFLEHLRRSGGRVERLGGEQKGSGEREPSGLDTPKSQRGLRNARRGSTG